MTGKEKVDKRICAEHAAYAFELVTSFGSLGNYQGIDYTSAAEQFNKKYSHRMVEPRHLRNFARHCYVNGLTLEDFTIPSPA